MVASAGVQKLTEGSDLLGILGEYLKNPDLIAQLQDEVVKLNTLNAEEEAQFNEAQILIQQRDSLTRQTDAQRQTLADEKTAHDAQVAKTQSDCDAYTAGEHAKLDKRQADLDAFEAELNDFKARLDQRENQLLEKAATVQGLFASANAA